MLELVNYTNLKARLGLKELTLSESPNLESIVASITPAIESFLGRSLEQIERTHKQRVFETQMIGLEGLPVISVSEIKVDDDILTDDDIDITEYGIRFKSEQTGFVNITYLGGYLQSELPDQIADAALWQTIDWYQAQDQVGSESMSVPGEGRVYREPVDLLKHIKSMLISFKHPLRLL